MNKKLFFWVEILFMYILCVFLIFFVSLRIPIEAVDQAMATKIEMKRAFICGVLPILYPIYLYLRGR